MNNLDNLKGLMTDMVDIFSGAKTIQSAFLEAKGISWDDARALDESGRESLQAEYKKWFDAQGGSDNWRYVTYCKDNGLVYRSRRRMSANSVYVPASLWKMSDAIVEDYLRNVGV